MADQMLTTPEVRIDGPSRGASDAVPAWIAALSGVIAAAVALAIGELITALPGSEQSLVASVGTSFIDRFAGSLKKLAVQVFGTNDKAALIVGIVIVAAIVGALTGIAARRWPAAPIIVFGAFAALGIAATSSDQQASLVIGAVAAVLAAMAGIFTLRQLLAIARSGRGPVRTTATRSSASTNVRYVRAGTDEPAYPRQRAGAAAASPEDGDDAPAARPPASRRTFFGWAAAAGAFAVVSTSVARALTSRSKAAIAREGVKLPPVTPEVPGAATTTTTPAQAPLGISGLSPYYVPNADFYRIDTALVVPQVDPADWKLSVTGMVDHPFSLSFDELLKLPMVEESLTLQCVSNDVGGDLVGNAKWQGVPLKTVLERAGVQPGATQIVGVSTDGFTAGFPTEVGLDGRIALIAVGMNGEPLPIAHGFPARLVVAGLYGYVSATKWLTEIRLTTLEDFNGYWIDRGWSKIAPIKTMSRIDVPTRSATLNAGTNKIAGVAWAPNIGIDKVEVQIDDGPWQAAQLAEVVSKNTWVQWVFDWDVQGSGRKTIRCRATDKSGYTQTGQEAPPEPDGATGYHEVSVKVA